MTERAFAAACPQHDCPPFDAVDANGDFFRLTRDNPPTERDFRTFAELGLRPREDNCIRCGLSCFALERDAVKLFQYMERRHPNTNSLGRHVARIVLTPADGKVKPTRNPSHHTWWMYHDSERLATFREVVRDARDDVDH